MLTLLLVLVLLAPSSALAADPAKAPDGFRGIKFGADLSKTRGMKKMYVLFGATNWEREGDKLFVGDIPCFRIIYRSFNNKLHGATAYFDADDTSAKSNAIRLGRTLTDIYGKPDEDYVSNDKGSYYIEKIWQFKTGVEVTFLYFEHEDNPMSYISYTYLPIYKQCNDYFDRQLKRARQEAAESAKKDL